MYTNVINVETSSKMYIFYFLIKVGHCTKFIEMRNGCHQRGPSGLKKYQIFEFSLLVDFEAFFFFFLIAIFEILFLKNDQCVA